MTFTRITTLAAMVLLTAGLAAPMTLAQKAPAKQTAKKTEKPSKTSTKKSGSKSTKKKTSKAATKAKTNSKSTASRTSAKSTKKSSSKNKPSACAGLAQTQCGAKKECGWIKPKKKVASNGRKLTAYCRKVAGIARKKKPK